MILPNLKLKLSTALIKSRKNLLLQIIKKNKNLNKNKKIEEKQKKRILKKNSKKNKKKFRRRKKNNSRLHLLQNGIIYMVPYNFFQIQENEAKCIY